MSEHSFGESEIVGRPQKWAIARNLVGDAKREVVYEERQGVRRVVRLARPEASPGAAGEARPPDGSRAKRLQNQ